MSLHYLPNKLPWLPRPALDAKPLLVPHGLCLLIYPDKGHGVDKRKEHRSEAHTPWFTINVKYIRVPLSGPVELSHELDPEPLGELLPDPRPQPVTPHYLNPVTPVLGRLGDRQEVSTDLSNILSTLNTS